jgi:hypothetical protein
MIVHRLHKVKYKVILITDQEGLFELVILNLILKWYNWSNFRFAVVDRLTLTTASLTRNI